MEHSRILRSYESTGTSRQDLDELYPVDFVRGKGALVWDDRGKEYIDFTGATGAIILGYCNAAVDNAVCDYISKNGNVFISKLSGPRVELANLVCDRFPAAEYVSFHKTGSCATSVAVRYAQVYTGKRDILSSGYHGWHDWQLNMHPEYDLGNHRAINFQYNVELLKATLASNPNVACIIVTPEPHFVPNSFLFEVQLLAKEYSVVFILDEVASGFRYGYGGFHKAVGLEPDLITLGKGLANGYSLSAVAGRRHIMQSAERTHTWSTFDSEIGPLVAALTTQKIIVEADTIESINRVGSILNSGIRSLLIKFGIRHVVTRYPSIFHIIFDDLELQDEWILETLQKGVVLSRFDYQLVSFSHTEEIVHRALSAMESALDHLKERFPDSYGQSDLSVSDDVLRSRTGYEIGAALGSSEWVNSTAQQS